ncbi:Homeobox-leucine zipper protein PROTODERMAL FACTOR 2 [Hibiscus syriacus]|uniref:Homeobox-leucine zipper protein PROTODERMAL FACTOR 2 n=1 Tax=Hibiscus syriacus TaxID=106335 RepID=A0A6A2WMB0_HIBSY|nr:Homeobox-leucine zipper protein PROTODERMAL FACTOR 2 [Hibiscus syriacus]
MMEGELHLLEMTQHTSESELARTRDDEFESTMKSGNENDHEVASGDDQNPRPNKKKRYHRHTQHQIQEMEAFFKECPHPDDKQRKELGRELGLGPLQVKFWFQNKRTQMKTQHERQENTQLRAENERLRADNTRFREALRTASCPNCGGPTAVGQMSLDEHHLRLENARLIEEIDSISAIATKYVGKPGVNNPLLSSPMPSQPFEFGAQAGTTGEIYGASGDLCRSISSPLETDKQMIVELAVAAMEELIRMAQMGEPLWMTGLDGTTCVLNEEEYIRTFPRGIGPKPSGLKCEASRETAVVIMNYINLVEILMDVHQWSTVFSGIVSKASTLDVLSTGVADNYNGALQVMAAEFQVPSPLVPTCESYYVRYCKQHAEGTWAVVDVSLDNIRPVDDSGVHNLYKQLVSSGRAFGAQRWIATLDRQCERLASVPTSNVGVSAPERAPQPCTHGRRYTGADDVRVMTRKSVDDPGRPPGIVLSAATSFWLPVSPKSIFNFTRILEMRYWDILSNGGVVQEMAHITNGRDTGNCVSLLRVNVTSSADGFMAGDPACGSGGSLLTVAFQILVNSVPTAKLSLGSVATVNNLIACTVERIKASLSCENT